MASATTSRTFPLAYVSQGDKDLDRLAFFHILERLKVIVQSVRGAFLANVLCRRKRELDGLITLHVMFILQTHLFELS